MENAVPRRAQTAHIEIAGRLRHWCLPGGIRRPRCGHRRIGPDTVAAEGVLHLSFAPDGEASMQQGCRPIPVCRVEAFPRPHDLCPTITKSCVGETGVDNCSPFACCIARGKVERALRTRAVSPTNHCRFALRNARRKAARRKAGVGRLQSKLLHCAETGGSWPA